MAGENYDYATVLFSQCVFGDPENRAYVQGFWEICKRNTGTTRKGPPWPSSRSWARASIRKAVSQSHWEDVLKYGLAVLKINPWTSPR